MKNIYIRERIVNLEEFNKKISLVVMQINELNNETDLHKIKDILDDINTNLKFLSAFEFEIKHFIL